ncbi:MAG: DUF1223 domain-containing protein [Paracoccaceae bacterium]
MRRTVAALLSVLSLWAGPLRADGPVVVELYTSQGCSSCPPADAMLRQLAEREDVLPLALHVDYWDYIGWADPFADPAYTARQRAYAQAARDRMIYTPQFVVQGDARVVGAQGLDLAIAIDDAAARTGVAVAATRVAGGIDVTVTGRGPGAIVQIVRFEPLRTTRIEHGENAGHTLDYANVVTEWAVVGDWDGADPWRARLDWPGARPGAVIVQEAGMGRILAAVRID